MADLYERYFDVARRAARGYLNCDDDAQDVAQTIFLRIWSAGPARINRPYPRQFFLTAATNLALDVRGLGGAARATLPPEFSISTSATPEDLLYAVELRALVRRAICGLPPGCRAVASLRYENGLTRTEVARALGISEKSDERHLARARRLLVGLLPIDELHSAPPGGGSGSGESL